jgi:hypothetical protein
MKLQIKYYMTDGIDLQIILVDETDYEVQCQTYHDGYETFQKYLIMKYPDYLYATIKSIKVIDIP